MKHNMAENTHPENLADLALVVVRWMAAIMSAVMLTSIVWATTQSDVMTGLAYLVNDRWGVVTLLDVYSGALVVAVWIWRCEKHVGVWLAWVLAVLCLGHLISVIYLLIRSLRARKLEQVFAPC